MCRGCYCGPGISSAEPGLLRKRRVGEYVAECRRREAARRQKHGDLPAYEPQRLPRPRPRPRLHARRPAPAGADRGGDPRDPRAHQQVLPRGRAQLRRLRLPDLPRQGRRRVLRHGRGRHVPAVHDRPGGARLPRAQRAVERPARRAPPPHQHREAGLHGPDGRRRRARAQQPAQHDPAVHAHPAAKKLKDRDDLDHDLKLVAEESERCKKIVGNLLDFARQSRVHVESVDVRDVRAAGGRLRRGDGASPTATSSTSSSTWRPACAPTSTATR